jgi:cobalt/nickel transport protein
MTTRRLVLVGLAVSALVAGVLSFYASAHPDGLGQVAESLGFADTARDSVTSASPLAGYAVSGVGDARLSEGLAGLVGIAVTGLLMVGLVLVLRRRASRRER